jgi:hypothetical protein
MCDDWERMREMHLEYTNAQFYLLEGDSMREDIGCCAKCADLLFRGSHAWSAHLLL